VAEQKIKSDQYSLETIDSEILTLYQFLNKLTEYMKEKIRENINNPEELERLYREDKKSFESGFEQICSDTDESELLKFWKIRLGFDKTPVRIKRNQQAEIFWMIAACVISGFLIKIPGLFQISSTDMIFYERNAGIIVFLGLTIYTVWLNKIFNPRKLVIILAAFLIPAIYINLLPSGGLSHTINLAYIHLPLLMWCVFGVAFTDFDFKDETKRIGFIKYNGELAVVTAIIVITGGILSGMTIGLFSAIGINIEKFYGENIIITASVCVPVVSTFIIKNYPTMANKIAPVIANIFSPLVLLTAVIYLAAILISGKDPYNDRNFLLIFNIMLIGVMAIIVFSVSETSITGKQKFNEMILLILSLVTIIIDLIALSAIFYRLGTYGISPNRLAILGSNLLISGNLVLIMIDLYKINFKSCNIEKVGITISKYLPVYAVWILFVIFGFPLIFGLK